MTATCPICARVVGIFHHPEDGLPRLYGHRVGVADPRKPWCDGGGIVALPDGYVRAK